MMKFSKIFFFSIFIVTLIFSYICWNVPFGDIYDLPNHLVVDNTSTEDVADFGSLINANYNENTNTVDIMLLNTVKLNSVEAITKKQVYLGGQTVGFSYYGDGVLVVSNNGLDVSSQELEAGDIIKSINNTPIARVSKITEILNQEDTKGQEVLVKIVRNDKEIEKRLKPAYDVLTKKYKLGIWAKESFSGIGTLTFIDPETGRFGALGHPIQDQSTSTAIDVSSGTVQKCSVLGVKRATRGTPGEIRGVFVRSKSEMGSLDKNCEYGIYGNLNLDNEIFDDNYLIDVGGRLTTKPGKAYIYSSIDGKNVRRYEIEIIKTNYQGASSPKNLVFKVADDRLLDITGGIVQGMSGSPIVQDGKLIGAVTHVFVNDPTKGFGIYIDNMLTQ